MVKPLEERITTLKDLETGIEYAGEVRVCTEDRLVVAYREGTTAEKKEVQFDVYDSATDKWTREDWECTYPNIDKLNATDITVRVSNHR
jgi:hypothetical protein